MQKKSKVTASRRMHLKSMILQKAKEELDQETRQKEEDKLNALNERVPPMQISGMSLQELQDKCKELHQSIDVADEERYDTNMKVYKQTLEVTTHPPLGGSSCLVNTLTRLVLVTQHHFMKNGHTMAVLLLLLLLFNH
uniref:Troponin I type 2a (skeletal, fast), tandem duplicate 4 n=1 Tax=Eptatretus burgeri TaxID=7764 RepID=A0A8C4QWJ3_EPTBU